MQPLHFFISSPIMWCESDPDTIHYLLLLVGRLQKAAWLASWLRCGASASASARDKVAEFLSYRPDLTDAPKSIALRRVSQELR